MHMAGPPRANCGTTSQSCATSSEDAFAEDQQQPLEFHRNSSCDGWLNHHQYAHGEEEAASSAAAASSADLARISFSSDVFITAVTAAAAPPDTSKILALGDDREEAAAIDDNNAYRLPNPTIILHQHDSINTKNRIGSPHGGESPARLSTASSCCKEGSSPPTSEFEFSMGASGNTIPYHDYENIEPGGIYTSYSISSCSNPGRETEPIPLLRDRERRQQHCLQAAADELFCDGKLLPLYYSGYNYSNHVISSGGGVADLQAPVRRRSNAGETTYDYYYDIHSSATADDGVPKWNHNNYNHRPAPDQEIMRMQVVRPAVVEHHPISPKAPTCTSRWKELLGLKKSVAQISADHDQQHVCSSSMRSRSATSSSWKGIMRPSDAVVHRIQAPPLVPPRRSLDSCNIAYTAATSSSSFRSGLQKSAPSQAIQRHSSSCTSSTATGTLEAAAAPPSLSSAVPLCHHYNYPQIPTSDVRNSACSDEYCSSHRGLCPTTGQDSSYSRAYVNVVGQGSTTIASRASSDHHVLDQFGADYPTAAVAAKHNGCSSNWTTKASESGGRGDNGQMMPSSCTCSGSGTAVAAGSGRRSTTSTWVKHYARGLVTNISPPTAAAAAGRISRGGAGGKASAPKQQLTAVVDHDQSEGAMGNSSSGAAKQQQVGGYNSGGRGKSLHRSYSGPLKPSAAARIKQQQAGGTRSSCGRQQLVRGGGDHPNMNLIGSSANSRAALERSSSYSAAGFRVTPVIHVPLYMITPGPMRAKLGGSGSKATVTSTSYGGIFGGIAQTVFSSSSSRS